MSISHKTEPEHPSPASVVLYYRLIALWVLCEAMLGGIIHAFKIPVSGLVVGSAAVICIALMAWYVPGRGNILRATVIVAIFKMLLSPQAPFPAYIAVFFQGALGEFLLRRRRFYAAGCFVLAILALLESGFQRLLMLTLFYGNELWVALNRFIGGITGQERDRNYSLWIGSVYLLLHLVTGIVTGWIASRLPGNIEKWKKLRVYTNVPAARNTAIIPVEKKKKRIKYGAWILWLILLLLYVQSAVPVGRPLLPAGLPLKIFIRSVLLLFSWWLIVGPLLRNLLHRWLKARKQRWQVEVNAVAQLLPGMQELVSVSWQRTAGKGGWQRVRSFVRLLLAKAVSPDDRPAIYILSGAIRQGKTSSLTGWIKTRNAGGILTPVTNGRRVFMDIATGEKFDMEADMGESDVLPVGRFRFSRRAFDNATGIIRRDMGKYEWLIIDEVGPLELGKEGFATVLAEAIATASERHKLLIVVREGIIDEVRSAFRLEGAVIIGHVGEIE